VVADDGRPLAAWLKAATARPVLGSTPSAHGEVVTEVAWFAEPLRMGPLALWLSLMTQMHGGALLRVKGLVAVIGEDAPVVIHTVGHVVYPARQLAAWPDDDRRTRLVFIARGLSATTLRALLINLGETPRSAVGRRLTSARPRGARAVSGPGSRSARTARPRRRWPPRRRDQTRRWRRSRRRTGDRGGCGCAGGWRCCRERSWSCPGVLRSADQRAWVVVDARTTRALDVATRG
jgi:hypothetical protein